MPYTSRWTKREKQLFKRYKRQHRPYAELAKRIGRTLQAVRCYAKRQERSRGWRKGLTGSPTIHDRLPAGMVMHEGAKRCRSCGAAIHDGTDGDGTAVIWCACNRGALRYARVIRVTSENP